MGMLWPRASRSRSATARPCSAASAGACGAAAMGSSATGRPKSKRRATPITSTAAVSVWTTSSRRSFLGGVVAGIADGDVDFFGLRDNADFQAWHVGLYGSFTSGQWYLDSVATYADLQFDTERFVDLLGERLTGEPDGTRWPLMSRPDTTGTWPEPPAAAAGVVAVHAICVWMPTRRPAGSAPCPSPGRAMNR
jgi:hypothetical protein